MALLYIASFVSLGLGPLVAHSWADGATQAPTITDPSMAISVSASPYPIVGTTDNNSVNMTVSVYRDNGTTPGVLDAGDTWVNGSTGHNQNFTYSVPLLAGANNFLVTAKDGSKSVSTATVVPTITYNAITPITPTVTPQDFTTCIKSAVSCGYDGMNVGFQLGDFASISGVTVTLSKGGTDIVSNTAKQDLLDAYNVSHVDTLSSPFVVNAGSFDPGNDTYWTHGAHTWNPSEQPDKATITVTGTDNVGATQTITAFNTNLTEGLATFASFFPAASVTGQDFDTWDNSPDFTAINVGFLTENFTHIDSLTVTLQKSGSDIVTNTASAAMLDDINNQQDGFLQNGQLSTPFIVSGTLNDTYCQGGPCWNAGVHTWQPSEQPDTAIVTIVGTDATGSVTKVATLTNFTQPNGVSFADLFPADTTPPSAPIGGQPNNSYETTNDFYFTWDAVTDPSTPVSYEFQSSLNPTSSGGVLTSGLWHSGTLTSPTIHSTGAPDGTWYWQVRAKDAAGNYSDWSTIWQVTIDTNAPTVSITAPSANQVVKGHAITIKGTVNDPNFNYYYCYVTDDHGEVGTRDSLCETAWAAGTPFKTAFTQTATGTTNGTLGTITLPNGQADGTYTVHVVAKDKAGNSTEATQTFMLDNTRPSLVFTAPTSFASFYKVAPTVTIHGSDANGLSVMVIHVYDADTNQLVGSPACTATPTELASGDLSCDLSGLPDGNYFVKAGANDTAGNNQTINSATFTVDSAAPDVTINSFTANGNVITPSVTATDPAPGTSLSYAWTANDTNSTNNVTVSDPAALEPDFTANADGTYNFTLTVTDQAGNATAKTFSFSYAKPVTPTQTLSGGQNNSNNNTSTGNGANFTNVATGNPGGTPQVLGDNTTTPATSDNTGQVKGAQTTNLNTDSGSNDKNVTTSGNFLGLGWWWLLVLALISGLWFAFFRRRNSEGNA